MIAAAFAHVRHWVFDLDNTLYPPEAALFDQIEKRMTAWVMREVGVDRVEADRLRRQYWADYGTTLAGLMQVHGTNPEPYLDDVHDISMDHLESDPVLASKVASLPGRKVVYTNGSAPYARRVLAARGLSDVFDDIFGVEHAEFAPKPEPVAFERVFRKAGVVGAYAAMFEDEPRNLAAPHAMGVRTVLVAPEPKPAPHIHYHTDDLAGFLSQVE